MEGKQRKNSDKIEPFPIFSEITESEDNMDEALRRQLMIEADEYEKILNSDQNLDYIDEIEEPPELFAAIIQKLKDEKKWVDEEETEPAKAEEILETVVGEEKKVNYAQGEENREQIYNLLSDEDKKALAIGKRKLAQRKRDKVLKFAGSAAMVCLCLLGVSMTSSANREYLMSVFNSFSNQKFSVSVDNNDMHMENKPEEEEACEDIENQIGIIPVKFMYRPDGMKYMFADIDTTGQNALLQYEYEETVMNVFMYRTYKESSANQSFDGKVIDTFTTTLKSQDEVEVKEIENPNNEKMYATEFVHDNGFYSIQAIMSKEDFTKLLNNIYF
ncbi:DUF4367 domain-containing protein [Robinsoniella peoriensis]|uniref:DUF4367 domain-containing protein n=1 Tax=Robinsoniella peoriensis TaxID=180332 RepID=UPI0005C7D354|nr:DUF4367 domain-containing protein [Robinsoniella peoriensis]